MQPTSDQLTEMHHTVQQLVQTLAQIEVRHERLKKSYRWVLLGMAGLFAATLYMTGAPGVRRMRHSLQMAFQQKEDIT